MHPEGEASSGGVPAFLAKLWTLVDDQSTDEFIAWDASGRSFHVFDQATFAKAVLPLFFKHSNIASFVRQLNMYGFRKVLNLDSGSLKHEKDDMEFAHPYFIKDREELLEHIKRKTAQASGHGDSRIKTEGIQEVLSDVKTIKGDQDFLSTKLDSLKKENEALWREVASMRQKHNNQQKIVNRLIQFLVSLVGNRQSRNLGKRKIPLMLNDANQIKAAKTSKFTRQLSFDGKEYQIESPESTLQLSHDGSLSSSSNSLKICDITEVTTPPYIAANASVTTQPESTSEFEFQIPQASHVPSTATQHFPQSASTDSINSQTKLPPELLQFVETAPGSDMNIIGEPDQGLLNETVELENILKDNNREQEVETSTGNEQTLTHLPSSNRSSLMKRELSREDLGQLVDNAQDSIDSLRDLLSAGQYNIDSSTLLGMFNNPDAGLSSDGLISFDDGLPTLLPEASTSGQEMTQYIPSMGDMNSLFDFDTVINDDPPEDDTIDLNTPVNFDLVSPVSDMALPTDILD